MPSNPNIPAVPPAPEIHFHCEECRRPLRAARAGEVVICEACHYATLAPVGAAPVDPRDLHPHDQPEPAEKLVRGRCPKCQHDLAASRQYAGRMVNCPNCHHLLLMPSWKPEGSAGAKSPAEIKHGVLRFRCRACQQRMGVLAEHADKVAQCPRCRVSNRVPRPGADGIGLDPAARGALPLEPVTVPAPIPEPAPIPRVAVKHGMLAFSCRHCAHELRVEAEHAGRAARCLRCRTVNRIPRPGEEAVGRPVEVAKGTRLEAAPAVKAPAAKAAPAAAPQAKPAAPPRPPTQATGERVSLPHQPAADGGSSIERTRWAALESSGDIKPVSIETPETMNFARRMLTKLGERDPDARQR